MFILKKDTSDKTQHVLGLGSKRFRLFLTFYNFTRKQIHYLVYTIRCLSIELVQSFSIDLNKNCNLNGHFLEMHFSHIEETTSPHKELRQTPKFPVLYLIILRFIFQILLGFEHQKARQLFPPIFFRLITC